MKSIRFLASARSELLAGMRSMKKEYDFSKGERGKFYHSDVELNLPVFLDPDVAAFLREVAEKKELKSRAS
jgi:hypothetical protein